MIDPKTGTLHLPHNMVLSNSTNFDELKETLQQHTDIDSTFEERYGLYQIVYLSHVEQDGKVFQFELFFDKKLLSSMMLDFNCTNGNNQTREDWLTEQVGHLREFDWGKVNTDEHPKFCVPLISLKYRK